ncbi:MAG: hypothetical protein LWY06_05845 [Firmicutes bacterium]|nr:hypothetical protein [Bacillota bacterium]
MQNRLTKQKGYTLFEVGIVLLLLALFLQAAWFVSANIYSYVSHTGKMLDSRNEAYRIFTLIKKDLTGSSSFTISSDNSLLTIHRSGGNIEYFLNKNLMTRKLASGDKILSKQIFDDLIWAKEKDGLTVCLSVPYKGYGKAKEKPIRIIENIETGGKK